MKKILVTGAAGLIGSAFIHRVKELSYLWGEDIEFLGVDNYTGGNNSIHSAGKIIKCDVESDAFTQIFKEFKPDIVYHMAAYAAEGLSPFIRKFNYTNNLVATANVINCCIQYGVERLVFLSSMAVYGNNEPPFDETFQQKPIDPYGIAKYACEMDIQVAGEQHGLDWCIIRPHNVYGEGQNIWDRYRNVLGIWMKSHLDGKPLNVFGTGEQMRAFTYVYDIAVPLYKAGTDPRASKQIINLGGTIPISIDDAATLLIDIMGGGEKVYLEGRHEVKLAYSTWKKSVDILGYKDKTSLRQGLANMWHWARHQTNDAGIARVWDQYEIDKQLYSFWKNE